MFFFHDTYYKDFKKLSLAIKNHALEYYKLLVQTKHKIKCIITKNYLT